MSALLDDPPQRTIEETPPPSSRRRLWLIPLILVLLVPVAFYVRDRWVSSYQPIRVGNGLFSFEVTGPREGAVRRFDTHGRPSEPMEVALVPFQKGGSLRMVFPIFHKGGPSIRVTHIAYGPAPSRFVTVLKPAGVEMGSQRTNNPVRMTRPFSPFTLSARDNPLIGLNYDFVCQRPSSGSQIIDTFRVRFETLGSSRWVELTLPWRLVVGDPTKEECPPGSAVFGS